MKKSPVNIAMGRITRLDRYATLHYYGNKWGVACVNTSIINVNDDEQTRTPTVLCDSPEEAVLECWKNISNPKDNEAVGIWYPLDGKYTKMVWDKKRLYWKHRKA